MNIKANFLPYGMLAELEITATFTLNVGQLNYYGIFYILNQSIMNTKKIKTIEEVEELVNNLIYNNNSKSWREVEPLNPLEKANTIIKVCQGALFNLHESWGHIETSNLHLYSYAEILDIINALDIANDLLPLNFLETLQNGIK